MLNALLVTEMAEVVQRERMVEIARLSRYQELARAGRNQGHVERARKKVGALLQRMGRPQFGGSAPAGGGKRTLDHSTLHSAHQTTGSMSIARF